MQQKKKKIKKNVMLYLCNFGIPNTSYRYIVPTKYRDDTTISHIHEPLNFEIS